MNRTVALALSALLMGCAPGGFRGADKAHFVTRCGVYYMGQAESGAEVSPWTEGRVQAMEDAALDAFQKLVPEWTLRRSCQALEGWQLRVRVVFSWEAEVLETDGTFSRGQVAGQTFCPGKVMLVGTPEDKPLTASGFIHEMAHAIQDCDSPQPQDFGESAFHSNWQRDRIYEAIDLARITLNE